MAVIIPSRFDVWLVSLDASSALFRCFSLTKPALCRLLPRREAKGFAPISSATASRFMALVGRLGRREHMVYFVYSRTGDAPCKTNPASRRKHTWLVVRV